MATKTNLKTLPGASESRRGPARKYDWDNWLDGSIWRLKIGEDIHAALPSFRAQASTAARVRQKYASVYVDKKSEGTVLIQGFPRENS